ncbi:uncharacterized protein PADG_04224 [Paracoccidioides brasiliensis Pb18]|uniref:Fungal-type protein kinase domain-containing protein n=1 Tax=Paracoccidioides brasiliensis (strain Pb18) TaxID=502780 RepID=C1GAD8_PARBD|nr:uncharacterized protein PADG_04224 [Paracoccidioides brasiliensis Pb18]EEH48140.2 hypothetical protein PADG_04224 [Paracoccidioides brasiliensis Pb18]
MMARRKAVKPAIDATSKLLNILIPALFTCLQDGDFSYEHCRTLVRLVIQKATNFEIWKAVLDLIATVSRATPPASMPPTSLGTLIKSTSSSQKGSEQTRELVILRIFEETHGCTFRGVKGGFVKYFEGKDWGDKADTICQCVLAPDSDSNWAQFLDPPTQDDVLAWWFHLQEDLLSESHSTYYNTQVNLLLQARGGSLSQNKHDWRDILVIDKLKNPTEEIRTKGTLLQMSCYQLIHAFAICGTKMEVWVFDYSGLYSSGIIDVYTDLRQFFQVLVGYTMMSDEELGLDIFIARDKDGSKSVIVKEPGTLEEKMLQLSEMLSFSACHGVS